MATASRIINNAFSSFDNNYYYTTTAATTSNDKVQSNLYFPDLPSKDTTT
jgi:hypothetical protein